MKSKTETTEPGLTRAVSSVAQAINDIDHCFGPCKEDYSVAGGLRQIAAAIRELASAVEGRQK